MPYNKENIASTNDAAIATQTALEAMRKLVTDEATNPKAARAFSSDGWQSPSPKDVRSHKP